MSLEPVAWEDYPSTATPLNSTTLNAQQAYVQAQADAAASARGLAEQAAADAEAAAASAAAPTATAVGALFADAESEAVAQLAVRLSEVDIRSYGAVCDGVTDDTVAVQAAIDAADAIRFPGEATTVVTALTVPGTRTFRGGGPGAIIKHADGAAPTTGSYTASMFNITSHDSTVRFVDLTLDGNYQGQGTANGANATETDNSFVSGGTITYGRLISADNLTPASGRSRLVIDVAGCTFRGIQYTGIVLNAAIDTAALHLLRVTRSSFYDMAPGIVGQSYVPAHGYASIPIGFDPSCIVVTGNVELIVDGCDFTNHRDPTVAPTAGFSTNLYNLSCNAIRVTVSGPGSTDPTPEYAGVSITGCTFRGFGRSNDAGNAIGVVDAYARARDLRIIGNEFTRSYQTPIRGKANCQRAIVANNVVNTVLGGGGGISFERATITAPGSAYKIVNNIVTNVDGVGITVIGEDTMTPPYVMDAEVSHNSVAFTGGRGIFLRRIYNPKIIGNSVRNVTGIGIYADLLTGLVTVTENTVLTASEYGIDLGYATAAASSNKMVVTNNQINVVVDYGIIVRDPYTLALGFNTVANVTGLSRGYSLATVSTQCMVVGNDASRAVTTQNHNFASAGTLRESVNSWN